MRSVVQVVYSLVLRRLDIISINLFQDQEIVRLVFDAPLLLGLRMLIVPIVVPGLVDPWDRCSRRTVP